MKHAFTLLTALLLAPLAALPATYDIRMGSGEKDFARYKEYGENVTPVGDLGKLGTYDEIAPGAIPVGSPLRAKIEGERAKFRRQCDEAAQAGLQVCIGTDEVTLPRAVVERFKKDIARDAKNGVFDFDSEKFWGIYRAKYREVLRMFPQVAFVMIRSGENYANKTGDYTGRTVKEKEFDDAYGKRMARLINETRKIVVDECGRTLIWRTWDLGNDGFHANPQVYDRVLAGVTEHKGLIFAVKHSQTDFWRYNDFNPNIGRGGVEQIIEFECSREYEGKGAFPNYLGELFSADIRHVKELGVRHIWIWNFGGGGGGPKLKNDRWSRANVDAVVQLWEHPARKPRDVAETWAAEEFGGKAAPKIADMLMLSGECVRKMVYIEAYALKHKGWMPSRGLMRDDLIRGERQMRLHGGLDLIYAETKDRFDAVLQEKADALALARQMLALYDSAKGDIIAERGEAVYQDARSTLLYLESLTEVMSHYIRGMFLFYRAQETHDASIAAQAKTELEQWRAAWSRYNTSIPKLPGAATLYRSQYEYTNDDGAGAMADTCEKALKKLGVK